MEKIGGEGQVFVVAFRAVSVESLEDGRKILVMSGEVRIMEGLIRHRDRLRHVVCVLATPPQRRHREMSGQAFITLARLKRLAREHIRFPCQRLAGHGINGPIDGTIVLHHRHGGGTGEAGCSAGMPLCSSILIELEPSAP